MTRKLETQRQTNLSDRGSSRATVRRRGASNPDSDALSDAVEAVMLCKGCAHSEECSLWLKRPDIATAPPPDHCTKPQLIQRLQEAHG